MSYGDPVQIVGSKAVESKTEQDVQGSDNNWIVFEKPVVAIDIYHEMGDVQTFLVNEIQLRIPPGGWRSLVGGVPSRVVRVPTGIEFTLNRLE